MSKKREQPAPEAVEQDLGELEKLSRERDEYLDLAQRTRADFENYRKRAVREAAEAERRGAAKLAAELVPVLDNLERALAAAGLDPEAEAPPEADGLAAGVLLVCRELRTALDRAGVEPYSPLGERFDPEWHEALQARADEGAESGTVIEVLEKGYRLDGLLLRAARVVVSE